MSNENGLTIQQNAAVEMLSRGMTWMEVAKELNVVGGTIWNWTKKPEFAALLEEKKREFYGLKVQNLDERMNSLETKAIDVLKDMLSEDKPDSVRLKAIQLILTHQNTRKASGEGQVLVNFNLPEPGMPNAENVEDGNTADK